MILVSNFFFNLAIPSWPCLPFFLCVNFPLSCREQFMYIHISFYYVILCPLFKKYIYLTDVKRSSIKPFLSKLKITFEKKL